MKMSSSAVIVTTTEKRIIRIRAYKHMESLEPAGAPKARLVLEEEYCSQIKTVQINTPRKGNL
jgi:hypothetical protein